MPQRVAKYIDLFNTSEVLYHGDASAKHVVFSCPFEDMPAWQDGDESIAQPRVEGLLF